MVGLDSYEKKKKTVGLETVSTRGRERERERERDVTFDSLFTS